MGLKEDFEEMEHQKCFCNLHPSVDKPCEYCKAISKLDEKYVKKEMYDDVILFLTKKKIYVEFLQSLKDT